MVNNLLQLIKLKSKDLSKGQKLIADYITNNYQKAAFMTASKLGNTVGVSESTVVRFAFELGFDGYPKMQKQLQELIKNKLTAVERIEVANEQIGSGEILDNVLNLDIDKIKKTLEDTSRVDFNKAVNAIADAKTIYVLGSRSASTLARFISFYFNLMFADVRLIHTTSQGEMFEQILRMNKDDVIIGISFPRYSSKTIAALQFAKDNDATVIAITDTIESPLAKLADCLLLASSDMASFVDSLVAPLSLINALIVAVGLKKSEEIKKTFNKLENIWQEYNVYEKTEDEESSK